MFDIIAGVSVIENFRALWSRGLTPLEWIGLGALLVGAVIAIHKAFKTAKRREALTTIHHPIIEQGLHKTEAKGGTETILLVDDEPIVLRMNASAVERLGYNVASVESGEAAIDWLKKNDADLMVLDIVMPNMDGITTLKEIKRFKPHQKAIALSGYARPSLVNEMLMLGVGAYLIKPTPLDALARAIRKELG